MTPAAKAAKPPAPTPPPGPPPGIPYVKPVKPPAEAKLELVEPVETLARPRGGHGVASRSLKRSSKALPAAPRRGPEAAPAAEGGRRKKDRGALVRRARGSGPPVGLLIGAPLVLVVGVGLALLVGGSSTLPPAPPPRAGVSRLGGHPGPADLAGRRHRARRRAHRLLAAAGGVAR
ncbi:MAG: hypothetical protein KF878_26915 [Planctomycetes bacterium]|nr:hypothetical protein [Planctomycetota bacterium]